MNNILSSIFIISLATSLIAADYPQPPDRYAYEIDLKPHSLVVTNVEGLAMKKDVIPREFWSAHENMGWSCYWTGDGLDIQRTRETFGMINDLTISPDKILLYEEDGDGFRSVYLGMGNITLRNNTDSLILDIDGISTPGGYLAFPKKRGTFAVLSDVEEVKSTIPQTVTNVVRDVQGLVYDEKLGITWKQTMYNGNLYYIAVTNENITEVK